MRRVAAAGLMAAGTALAQPSLAPLDGPGAMTAPPWREVLLPQQSLPRTRFTIVELDGQRALRIESAGSYGNLVHELLHAATGDVDDVEAELVAGSHGVQHRDGTETQRDGTGHASL